MPARSASSESGRRARPFSCSTTRAPWKCSGWSRPAGSDRSTWPARTAGPRPRSSCCPTRTAPTSACPRRRSRCCAAHSAAAGARPRTVPCWSRCRAPDTSPSSHAHGAVTSWTARAAVGGCPRRGPQDPSRARAADCVRSGARASGAVRPVSARSSAVSSAPSRNCSAHSPRCLVIRSGGEDIVGSVGPEQAIVVATTGAEPYAEGGYAAAVLLDSLWPGPGLDGVGKAIARRLRALALVRASADGGRALVLDDTDVVVRVLQTFDPVRFAHGELTDRRATRLPPRRAHSASQRCAPRRPGRARPPDRRARRGLPHAALR